MKLYAYACASGWVVSGLGESRAKVARKAFKPKLKKSSGLLTNPALDEANIDSKANVDHRENVYRNQTFKLLDLAKPLLFLASRVKKKKNSRAEKRTGRTALNLWTILYHDITNARRRNILTQIYPQNVGLLDEVHSSYTGGDHVFGLKFTQALVEQVKTMKALNQVGGIRRNSGSSNSSSGKNGHRSSSSQHGSKTNKGHSLPEISSNKTQNPVWDKLLALHQSGPNLRLTHGSCPPSGLVHRPSFCATQRYDGRPAVFEGRFFLSLSQLSFTRDLNLFGRNPFGMRAIYEEVRTGGPCLEGEIGQHINFLELLAARKTL